MTSPEITPEAREAALVAVATVIRSGLERPWAFQSPAILDALRALGWGPTAEANAQGWREGREAAAKECRKVVAEMLRGQKVVRDQPRRLIRRPMCISAVRCGQRIRALSPSPAQKEEPK